MRTIDADALLDEVMERHCKECDKRKGIKNGKYRIIYEIGDAPCRACDVDDVKDELEDAPTIEPRCEVCEAFNKTRLLIPQPERKKGKWIPCSKKMPERNRVVLVTTKWDEVTEGVKLSGNAWFIGRGEENAFDSDIIAWMPLPEPYKEGGAV